MISKSCVKQRHTGAGPRGKNGPRVRLPLTPPPSPIPFFSSQLFKGKFYYCVGLDVKNITNKSDCLAANYRWIHHKYNFDNLGQVQPAGSTVSH